VPTTASASRVDGEMLETVLSPLSWNVIRLSLA
jgi:hypothetical protein